MRTKNEQQNLVNWRKDFALIYRAIQNRNTGKISPAAGQGRP